MFFSKKNIYQLVSLENFVFLIKISNGTSFLYLSCRYLHDVIYITLFVQLASIISGKFWWTYLVVRSPVRICTTVHFLLTTKVMWTSVEQLPVGSLMTAYDT
jgi:hypothetical protein